MFMMFHIPETNAKQILPFLGQKKPLESVLLVILRLNGGASFR